MLKSYNRLFVRKKLETVILLLLFCGWIGCKDQQDRLSENTLHFPIGWSEIQEIQKKEELLSVEQWFDTLEVIKSPDVDRILLVDNRIQRIILTERYFIALSDEALMACGRYDTTGFIYNKIGRGPGEYERLSDVVYDKSREKLLVLTSYPNKILTLDMEGNFVSSYTLPYLIDWDRLYIFRNQLYLLGSDYNQKTGINLDVIARYDGTHLAEQSVITRRLLYGTEAKYWTLGESQDHLVVGIDERDSLFRITEDLTVTPIHLDFAFEKELPQDRIAGQYFYWMNGNRMLFVRYMPNGVFYNFGHRFRYDCSTSRLDVSIGKWFGTDVGSDKENIYCCISPLQQKIVEHAWKAMSPATRKFYESLRKVLAELDENDNPFLLRYHIKKE
ncbi:hypothetical protein I1900192L5_13650 [Odoribacter splanchnicus]